MGLFNRNQAAKAQLSQRQILENTINNSRNNILIVLIFTIVNILLLVSNANTYFLFSAYVPYMLADLGMYLTGRYPAAYYGEELPELMFFQDSFLAIMLSLAAIVLILYALCWVLAKKNPKGWMIFALVLFSLDTVLLFLMGGISAELIVDYLFHGWVIVSFSSGLSAIKKLKDLPEDSAEPEYVVNVAAAEEPEAATVEE